MSAGPEIERLIQLLSKLPGLGPRSARRASLSLLQKRDQLMKPLADSIRRRWHLWHPVRPIPLPVAKSLPLMILT